MIYIITTSFPSPLLSTHLLNRHHPIFPLSTPHFTSPSHNLLTPLFTKRCRHDGNETSDTRFNTGYDQKDSQTRIRLTDDGRRFSSGNKEGVEIGVKWRHRSVHEVDGRIWFSVKCRGISYIIKYPLYSVYLY